MSHPRLALALLLSGICLSAAAQYRVVGPDGRVTYTDKPPPAAAPARPDPAAAPAAPAGGLPYEVQRAASRYPVAVYAARACAPCDQARQWLRTRGIPFAEYSIDSNADINQLKQRFGEATLPVVTIGGQTLKGFSSADLESYADAAGYPKQARLAASAWPAPVPLAPAPAIAPVAPPAADPGARIDLPPPSKSGIQF